MQKIIDPENCVNTEAGSTQDNNAAWKTHYTPENYNEFHEHSNYVIQNQVTNFHWYQNNQSCNIEQRVDFATPVDNVLQANIQIMDKNVHGTYDNLDHIETNGREHSFQRQEETLDMYKIEPCEEESETSSQPNRTQLHINPVSNENLLNCLKYKNEVGSDDSNEIDHITNNSTKESERAKTELSSSESNRSGNHNLNVPKEINIVSYEQVASTETKNIEENEQETVRNVPFNNGEHVVPYQEGYIENQKEENNAPSIPNYREFFNSLKQEVENECEELKYNHEIEMSGTHGMEDENILEEYRKMEMNNSKDNRVPEHDNRFQKIQKNNSIEEAIRNNGNTFIQQETQAKDHVLENEGQTSMLNDQNPEFIGTPLLKESKEHTYGSTSMHNNSISLNTIEKNLEKENPPNDNMKKGTKRKRKTYSTAKNRKNKNAENSNNSRMNTEDGNRLEKRSNTSHVDFTNQMASGKDGKSALYDRNGKNTINRTISENLDMFNFLTGNEQSNEQLADWFNAIYTVCVRLDDLCINLCEEFPHSMNLWEQNGCMVLQMKSFFYNDAVKRKEMVQEKTDDRGRNQNITTQSKGTDNEETHETQQEFMSSEQQPFSYVHNSEMQQLLENDRKTMSKMHCIDNYPFGTTIEEQRNYYESMEPYNMNQIVNDAMNYNMNHFMNHNMNQYINQMTHYNNRNDQMNETELYTNAKLPHRHETYEMTRSRMEMIDRYNMRNKMRTCDMNFGRYKGRDSGNDLINQSRGEIQMNHLVEGNNETIENSNYDFPTMQTNSSTTTNNNNNYKNKNNEYFMGTSVQNLIGNEECENFLRNNSSNLMMYNYNGNGIQMPLSLSTQRSVNQMSNSVSNSRNSSTSITRRHTKQDSITNEDKKLIKKKKKIGSCKGNNKIIKTEKDYEYLLQLPEKDGPSADNPEDLKCDVAGVYWDKRSWIASWYDNGKRYYKSFSAKTHGFYKSKFWSIKVRLSKVKGQTIFGKNSGVKRNSTVSHSSNSSSNNSVCMENPTNEHGVIGNQCSIKNEMDQNSTTNVSEKNDNYINMDPIENNTSYVNYRS